MKYLTTVLIFVLAAAVSVIAADSADTITITGEVVGTACWLGHGMKGADHAQCAAMCARNGIPLAILDTSSDTVYLPVATDHQDPNAPLMDYIESKVTVTGQVVDRSGMKGLVIQKIGRPI